MRKTISNEQQRRMRKVVEELVKRDPVALEKWLRDAEKGIAYDKSSSVD